MTFIAINMSERTIDGIAPQQDKVITEKQAEVYRRLLPNDIKIVSVGDEPTKSDNTNTIDVNTDTNADADSDADADADADADVDVDADADADTDSDINTNTTNIVDEFVSVDIDSTAIDGEKDLEQYFNE